ncbi:MAG: LysR family transcriptional regulator [Lentisphaerae bacterium]|nr:LysR family transcriptional regulator [Lentisphaerota bacterium]
MTLDLIRTFIFLNETKNFGQAAKLLFVSQSTVSVRIKALEEELNCTLFYRNNKQVELSRMGEQFLPHAIRLYQAMSDCQSFMQRYDRFEKQLVISAPVTCWEYGPLQNSVLSYCEEHSDTLIHLLRDSSEYVYRQLIKNDVDLGVLYVTPPNPDIEYIPYATEYLFLVASPSLKLPPLGNFLNIEGTLPNLVRPSYATTASKLVEESLYMLPCNIVSDHPRLYLELVKRGYGVGLLQSNILTKEIASGTLEMVDCSYNNRPMPYKNYLAYFKREEQNLQPLIDRLLRDEKSFEEPSFCPKKQ